MSSLLFLIAALVFAAPVAGYAASNATSDPSKFECARDMAVSYRVLDDTERDIYWKNISTRDDYLLVTLDAGYLKVIDQLLAQAEPVEAEYLFDGLTALAKLVESPYRQNFFFEFKDRRRKVLLTRWRFQEDGGKICVPIEFINIDENIGKGTISFVVVPGVANRGIWKMRWVTPDDRVQYEIYVEDEVLPEKEPGTSSISVKRLAGDVVTYLSRSGL